MTFDDGPSESTPGVLAVLETTAETERPRDQKILAFLENELGLQAIREQQPGSAVKHFEAALDLDKLTVPAYLNLGDVRLTQGDPRGAIEIWEQLIRVTPERAYLAFSRLEHAYATLGTRSRFLELCRRLVEANPQDWRARLALGQHVADNGEPARALDLLFEALVHNPHALTVHQVIWQTLGALDFNETLVRRYVDLTREAVFYLDPHLCIRCRYRSTELLWQCPQCHEWNTFVEERIAPAEDSEETPA